MTQAKKLFTIKVMKILVLLMVLLFRTAHSAEGYTFKDLEILVEQGNYRDFFLHAKDIRPALRSEYWKQMVRQMAVGWLDFKSKRSIFDQDSFQKIEDIALWPALRGDRFFQIKRGEYAIQTLQRCFAAGSKKHPECLKGVEQFWMRSQKMATTGYRLAKLLAEQKQPGGWRYLSEILAKEEAAVYCGEKLVQDEFLKAMKKWDNKTVHPSCWKSMATMLKKFLWENSNAKSGAREEQVFNILVEKGELNEAEQDFYFALFILNGPTVGKTFNQAWNRMKALGEDYSRRQKVLQRLKKLDPMPDGVVGIPRQSKRTTLLNFFTHHFPEYFNHYIKVCLNYLEGKASFPQGNPTVRCRDFFRYTDSLVSDKLYLRYGALKKKGIVVD